MNSICTFYAYLYHGYGTQSGPESNGKKGFSTFPKAPVLKINHPMNLVSYSGSYFSLEINGTQTDTNLRFQVEVSLMAIKRVMRPHHKLL